MTAPPVAGDPREGIGSGRPRLTLFATTLVGVAVVAAGIPAIASTSRVRVICAASSSRPGRGGGTARSAVSPLPVPVPVPTPAPPRLLAREEAPPPMSRDQSSSSSSTTSSSSLPSPRLMTTDDIRREMQKARGRVLIVHLWATWCGPCLEELPRIDRFARDARARGAVVLAISVDSDYRGIARVPAVLRARAPSLPAAVAHFTDSDAFRTLFWAAWEGSIPASFIYDRAGRLHKALLNGAESSELETLLDEVLPPKPALPAGGPGGAAGSLTRHL